jgi:type II secretory pathway pseudopilin PulG
MMEMMGAVAILVIVFALGIPSLFNLQKQLRMMELDAKAQQIYNAAQSQLTTLQSTGKLDSLSDEITTSSFIPSDYPSDSSSSSDDTSTDNIDIRYVVKGDTGTEEYLFTDEGSSISKSLLSDGAYVIELSPKTGEIYAVYYWEQDATDWTGSADSTSDITTYYQEVNELRTRESRSDYTVGYYGGKEVDSAVSQSESDTTVKDSDFSDIEFSVVNNEELYVKINSDGFKKLAVSTNKNDVTITVTVTDTSNSKSFSISQQGSNINDLTASSDEVDVVLDSMRSDEDWHFADIAGDSGVTIGANIAISVTISIAGDSINVTSGDNSATSVTTNSLFGTGTTYTSETDEGTAYVSCLRHLNNLRSGVANSGGAADYKHIVLTSDIDFDGTQWSEDSVSVQSRNYSKKQALANSTTTNYNPLEYFTPISGSRYFSWGNSSDVYLDGQGHILKNFLIGQYSDQVTRTNSVSQGNDSVGLFSSVSFAIKDLSLEDATVYGASNVGAIAGSLGSGGSITNCYVFGNTLVRGTSAVGGIAGTYASSGSLSGCSIGYDSKGKVDEDIPVVIASQSIVGGLVGSYEGYAISSCKVLANVSSTGTDSSGNSYVGGLAGTTGGYTPSIESCSIGNSDHKVSITGAGAYVGGLIGSYGGNTISSCTVIADVSGNSYVGGFIGSVSGYSPSIKNCSIGESGHIVSISGTGAYVGGLVGKTSNCSFSFTSDVVFADVSSTGTDSNGYSYVGGLVGMTDGGSPSIDDCSIGDSDHIVNITGKGAYVGGLAGYIGANTGQTSPVYSYANVVGASNTGGAFGFIVNDGKGYKNIYVVGSVTATGNSVGGFAGEVAGGTTESCSVVGSVTATGDSVGGFAGKVEGGTIESCVVGNDEFLSQGNFKATSTGNKVGGFIGYQLGWATVKSNSVIGYNVSGTDSVGGFVGLMEAGSSNSNTVRKYANSNEYCSIQGSSHIGQYVGQQTGGSLTDNTYADAKVVSS